MKKLNLALHICIKFEQKTQNNAHAMQWILHYFFLIHFLRYRQEGRAGGGNIVIDR